MVCMFYTRLARGVFALLSFSLETGNDNLIKLISNEWVFLVHKECTDVKENLKSYIFSYLVTLT